MPRSKVAERRLLFLRRSVRELLGVNCGGGIVAETLVKETVRRIYASLDALEFELLDASALPPWLTPAFVLGVPQDFGGDFLREAGRTQRPRERPPSLRQALAISGFCQGLAEPRPSGAAASDDVSLV